MGPGPKAQLLELGTGAEGPAGGDHGLGVRIVDQVVDVVVAGGPAVTAFAQAAAVGVVAGAFAPPAHHRPIEGAGILSRLGRVLTHIPGHFLSVSSPSPASTVMGWMSSCSPQRTWRGPPVAGLSGELTTAWRAAASMAAVRISTVRPSGAAGGAVGRPIARSRGNGPGPGPGTRPPCRRRAGPWRRNSPSETPRWRARWRTMKVVVRCQSTPARAFQMTAPL